MTGRGRRAMRPTSPRRTEINSESGGRTAISGLLFPWPGSSPLTQPVKFSVAPKRHHPSHSKSDKKSARQCVLFLANPYTCLRIKTMNGIAVSKGLRLLPTGLLATSYWLLATSYRLPAAAPSRISGRTHHKVEQKCTQSSAKHAKMPRTRFF